MEAYCLLQALDFLVRAHRTRTQSSGWENDLSQIKEVVELTLHLSDGKQTCFGKKKKRKKVKSEITDCTYCYLVTRVFIFMN